MHSLSTNQSLAILFCFIFRVSTAGGTATTDQDYVGLSNQQVTFTSGDGVKEVSTPIIDDDEVEGNESFVVHLELQDPSNPSATLGPKSNVTIIIVDNDQPPGKCQILHLVFFYQGLEEGGALESQ